MARTLHADPDFPNRTLDGGRYRPCIACNYCIDSLAAGPIPCTVNPWVGREAEQPTEPAPIAVRVAVVGAGPSGMAAARELALVGHGVHLFDERNYLGGDFALASALHEYPEYGRLVDWYRDEIAELKVACHLGSGWPPPISPIGTSTRSCWLPVAAVRSSISTAPRRAASATCGSSCSRVIRRPRRSRSSGRSRGRRGGRRSAAARHHGGDGRTAGDDRPRRRTARQDRAAAAAGGEREPDHLPVVDRPAGHGGHRGDLHRGCRA